MYNNNWEFISQNLEKFQGILIGTAWDLQTLPCITWQRNYIPPVAEQLIYWKGQKNSVQGSKYTFVQGSQMTYFKFN